MDKKRFQDTGESIYSFIDEFLVICPRCQQLAIIKKLTPESTDLFEPRRLSCCHCGLSKHWAKKSFCLATHSEPPIDGFFGLPLFLATPCCGHTLWAYNLRHLSLIQEYVSAELRQHAKDNQYGWNNSGLINRLPQWMTAARNRENILKTINDLKIHLQKATEHPSEVYKSSAF